MKRPPQLVQAELFLSYLLRYGVLLCGTVIALGMALNAFMSASRPGSFSSILPKLLSGQMVEDENVPRTALAFSHGIQTFDPNTIIALGLLLLIALPIVRVGATVVLFFLEKDFVYLFITLVVFCTLMAGIIFGKAL